MPPGLHGEGDAVEDRGRAVRGLQVLGVEQGGHQLSLPR